MLQKNILILLFPLFCCKLLAQPAKPFPQHVAYFKGVIKPNNISQEAMDDSVRLFYNQWKASYLKNDCGNSQYYVWADGAKKQSVSEGHGYGMVIIALMAGHDEAAQKIFDGLYYYFKQHPSKRSPYLMSWAQTKDFKDIDGSSATDGDMDIAYGLLLANKQWGSNGAINYLEEAKKIIAAIMQQEINPTTFSIIISNAVEHDSKAYFDMRSSDFMPSHFRAFKNASNNLNWNKVIDTNYKRFLFMQDKFSPDAGLVPDFILHTHKQPVPAYPLFLESKFDGCYNYNACRVPWRVALDYIRNGKKDAKLFIDKINAWLRETTENNPDNISAGYSLEGNDLKHRNYEALSFIGPFAVAAMVDSKNQDWLNKVWNYLLAFRLKDYDYYDNSIKMLNMIILSGNYWNPS